jgi:hypothetical protein
MISDYLVVTQNGYSPVYQHTDSLYSLDLSRPMFVETHSDDLMLRSWNVLRELANTILIQDLTWVNLCEDVYGISNDFKVEDWKPTYKDVPIYEYFTKLEDVRRLESLLGFLKLTDGQANWTESQIKDLLLQCYTQVNDVTYTHISGVHKYNLEAKNQRFDGNGKFLSYESHWGECKQTGDIVADVVPSVIVTHSWIDQHPHHFMSLLKILDTAGQLNIPVVMLSPLYANDLRSTQYVARPVTEVEMYAHLGAFTTTYLSQVMRNPYVYESTIQKTLKAHSHVGMHETYAVYEVKKCQ